MSKIAIEPVERPVAVAGPGHAIDIEHAGHGDGHGHHGPAFLHHHFTDVAQQRESNQLGMWVFMVTEIMTFGALFFVYALYRHLYETQAHEAGFLSPYGVGSHLLDNTLGFANTLVLLVSSLTVATAVHAAGMKNKKLLLMMLCATWVFGAIFLGIKAYEWNKDYQEQIVPGLAWNPRQILAEKGFLLATPTGVQGEAYLPGINGLPPTSSAFQEGSTTVTVGNGEALYAQTVAGLKADGKWHAAGGHGAGEEHEPKYLGIVNGLHMQMFFVIYFCMTGLHAIHMIIGLFLLAIYIVHARNGMFTAEANDQPVEIFGLYWHFVDIVWVFLYPLLYLATIAVAPH